MNIKLCLLLSFFVFFDTSTSSLSSPTTPSSQENNQDNISIQNVLSSDINADEKIEKIIAKALAQYSSTSNQSHERFAFYENSVTIDLGSENAIFSNIHIIKSSPSSRRWNWYSTKIRTIEINLPEVLEIHADTKVTKIANSSSESPSSPSDVLDTGSMNLTLENITISKQFYTQADDPKSSTSKIFYTISAISLNITRKFQKPIYSKLEVFFDDIESPLTQFLIEKLNAELVYNGTSVADNHSGSINADKSSKTDNSNNLYVIPNSKSETWKGFSLSAGPIIIDGLSSFTNAELAIIENQPSTSEVTDSYSRTTPRYFTPRTIPPPTTTLRYHYYHIAPKNQYPEDPESKEIIVKITTNDLKGKFGWSYNSNQRSIPFTLGFIQFEVKRYTHKIREYEPFQTASYESVVKKTTVDLNFGDIQINSSKSSVCGDESEFVNFVLPEYLKTVITDSFRNSLIEKI